MAAGPSTEDRRRDVVDAELEELERRGVVTRPTGPSKEPPPRSPLMDLSQLMRELDDDRTDRDWTAPTS